jgi:hypothetical protein
MVVVSAERSTPHSSLANETIPGSEATPANRRIVEDSKPTPLRMTGICESIYESTRRNTPFQFTISKDGTLYCRHGKLDTTSYSRYPFSKPPTLTVNEALKHSKSVNQPVIPNLRARLRLAINLLSSFLQLHITPWMQEPRTTQSIVFCKTARSERPGDTSCANVGAENPLISYNVASVARPQADIEECLSPRSDALYSDSES